uniref:Uncharacterized protein n=1 Tax=Amphimedon queenslandica TaxID=400682 RepID=A0A1X7VGC7_AMPQE
MEITQDSSCKEVAKYLKEELDIPQRFCQLFIGFMEVEDNGMYWKSRQIFGHECERTDNNNVWEENHETEVIMSYTANQRTSTVTFRIVNKTPETVSSMSKEVMATPEVHSCDDGLSNLVLCLCSTS